MLFASTASVFLAAFVPQGPESSGPMAAVPHTISVSSGTLGGGSSVMSSAQIYIKEPGYTTAAPD